MDSITFEVENVTIQLVNDRVLIWKGVPEKEAEIDLPIAVLRNALSAASMLVKSS